MRKITMTEIVYRHCRKCNSKRQGLKCWKCGDDTHKPADGWDYPVLPDVPTMRRLAAEVGYALAEHGSKERDLDLVAAPWREDAVSAQELAEHIAKGMDARVLAPTNKPLGRWACNIGVRGWYVLIDLSVCPRILPPEVTP
jgi:hypothetical protein